MKPDIERVLFPTRPIIQQQPSEHSSIPLPIPQPQRKSSWIPYIPNGISYDKHYREGLDLLDKLLVYDHEKRLNAKEAMNHSFFDEVRAEIKSEMANTNIDINI